MESFRRQLKKRVLKYLGINILIYIPILFIVLSIIQSNSFFDTKTILIFGLIFYTIVILLNTFCFRSYSELFYKRSLNIILNYAYSPSILIILFYIIYINREAPFWGLFLISLPFFQGQLISLFLILKFIEKNKPTQNS